MDALVTAAPPEVALFVAYPRTGELYVESGRPRELRSVLPLDPASGLAGPLEAAIAGVGADVLHVHSPALGPAAIAEAALGAGARLAVTLHDHSLVCENYELLEGGIRYCGIPSDLRRCDACLEKTRGRPPGAVQEWRGAVRSLVTATDAFVAPSESVLEHAARLHPEVRRRAHRIPWGIPAPSARAVGSAREGPLRVAIVGLLSTVKGRDRLGLLLSAARDVNAEWHVFGATEGDSLRDVRRAARRLVVHGAYPRHALGGRLVASKCHVVLLPSVGAEAFSLTLSEVASVGIPVVASELGALGERVREQGLGWTFDPWDEAAFSRLCAELERDRGSIDRVAARVRSLERRTEERMAEDHGDLWTRLAALPPRGRIERPELIDAFRRGAALARSRTPSALARAIDALRRTDFYRDLSLRRALPVAARKRIEEGIVRAASRMGRR